MKRINTQPTVVICDCNLKGLRNEKDLKNKNWFVKELGVNSAQTAICVGNKSSSISFKVSLPVKHFYEIQAKSMDQIKDVENILAKKQQNPLPLAPDAEMANMSNVKSKPLSSAMKSTDQHVFKLPQTTEIKLTTAVTNQTEISKTIMFNKIDLKPKTSTRVDNTPMNANQMVPEIKSIQPFSDRTDVAETLMTLRNSGNTIQRSVRHNLPLSVIPDRIKFQTATRISPMVKIKNKPNYSSSEIQTDDVKFVNEEQYNLIQLVESSKISKEDIKSFLKNDNSVTMNHKRRLTYSEIIEIDDEDDPKEIDPEAKDALVSYSKHNKNIINTIFNLTSRTTQDNKSGTALILNTMLEVTPEKAKAINCLLKKMLEIVSDKELLCKLLNLLPRTQVDTVSQIDENAISSQICTEKQEEISTNTQMTNNVVKEVLKIMNSKSFNQNNLNTANETSQTVFNDHIQQHVQHNQNSETQMSLNKPLCYQIAESSNQNSKKDVVLPSFEQQPHTPQQLPQQNQQPPLQLPAQHNTQHTLLLNQQHSQQHSPQLDQQQVLQHPPLHSQQHFPHPNQQRSTQQLKEYTQNISSSRVMKVNLPRPTMRTDYPKKHAGHRNDGQHVYDTTQPTNFDYYHQQKQHGGYYTQQFMNAHWKGYNFYNKRGDLSQFEGMQRQQYGQSNQAQQSMAAGQWYATQNQQKQQDPRANWEYHNYHGDWSQRKH